MRAASKASIPAAPETATRPSGSSVSAEPAICAMTRSGVASAAAKRTSMPLRARSCRAQIARACASASLPNPSHAGSPIVAMRTARVSMGSSVNSASPLSALRVIAAPELAASTGQIWPPLVVPRPSSVTTTAFDSNSSGASAISTSWRVRPASSTTSPRRTPSTLIVTRPSPSAPSCESSASLRVPAEKLIPDGRAKRISAESGKPASPTHWSARGREIHISVAPSSSGALGSAAGNSSFGNAEVSTAVVSRASTSLSRV